MYIDRSIEKIIKNRINNSKCLLLTGARQVGKSTLLKNTYNKYNYITLDDLIIRNNAVNDPKLFISNERKPAIIDEIQYAGDLFSYIKIECDNSNSNGQYILTGSQQLSILDKASESLAGRVSILELNGLSLREINKVKFNKHFVPNKEYITDREKELKKYKNIWEIIHRGSYPELYVGKRDWNDYYSSYVKTYLERDIKLEINLKDELTFIKFLTAIASRTGQMLNYNEIANEAGVSLPTIKNWVSILNRTGIVFILEPYYSNHLKRAIKTPKLYFKDTGLACYLTRWNTPETLENGAMAGHMFETFIINEIIKSFSNEGKEYRFNVFYYRGKDNSEDREYEIDLIIEENGILYPIEIKKTASPTSGMASCFKTLDNETHLKRGLGAIVCLSDRKIYLKDNLVVLPIEYI